MLPLGSSFEGYRSHPACRMCDWVITIAVLSRQTNVKRSSDTPKNITRVASSAMLAEFEFCAIYFE